MFNPIPPRESMPPPAEPSDTAGEEILVPGKSQRILAFAIKRGAVLALIFGGPLGLLIGLAAPSRDALFLEDHFAVTGSKVFFWTFGTVAVFIPFMIFVCAIAMATEVIAQSIARSSRRTAQTVRKCLERRFDSHL